MKKKIVWVVVSGLMVLALLVTSCAKAEEKVPAVKEAAPAVKEAAPVVKEAAPVVKEAAPAAGAEMVKVKLTKLDGTVMEKLVEKPKYGGVVTVSQHIPVLNWDEAFTACWQAMHNISVINEELLDGDWARGPGGTGETDWLTGGFFDLPYMTGTLAESWELADPETLVFHIRKGVKWALNPDSAASRLVNGRELTADDIVWNIRRIYFDLTFSTSYGMAGASRPVDAYATDKYTVVVKAASGQAGPTLMYVSDWMRIMAPEVGKKYGDFQAWENSVGTGPFMVVDHVPMSSITYVRNPNYWGKDPLFPENQLPYLDGIKQLIIIDPSTLRAAYRTAQITWNAAWALPRVDMKPLVLSTPELKYVKMITSYMQPAGRMDKPELPFKDIRVRRALWLAIDNPAIVDTYLEGEGEVLAFEVPPKKSFMAAYTPLEELPPSTRELYEYHPDKAKQLLAEAGYPNGFKTELVFRNTTDYTDAASILKNYWAKVGIDLTLDVKEIAVAELIYMRKTHKEMLMHGRTTDTSYEMWNTRTGNIYNWAMCGDPWIDRKYAELSAAFFEPAKRLKLLKEINLYTLDKAWYFIFPSADTYIAWWPWLKNYHGEFDIGSYNRPGVPLRIAWLDLELKKSMGR